MRDATEPWRGIAEQLALMPTVITRLLAQHVPNREGCCCGCGMPGTGSPHVVAPCGLWEVAEAARKIRESRR
jgi:hypothetical protein